MLASPLPTPPDSETKAARALLALMPGLSAYLGNLVEMLFLVERHGGRVGAPFPLRSEGPWSLHPSPQPPRGALGHLVGVPGDLDLSFEWSCDPDYFRSRVIKRGPRGIPLEVESADGEVLEDYKDNRGRWLQKPRLFRERWKAMLERGAGRGMRFGVVPLSMHFDGGCAGANPRQDEQHSAWLVADLKKRTLVLVEPNAMPWKSPLGGGRQLFYDLDVLRAALKETFPDADSVVSLHDLSPDAPHGPQTFDEPEPDESCAPDGFCHTWSLMLAEAYVSDPDHVEEHVQEAIDATLEHRTPHEPNAFVLRLTRFLGAMLRDLFPDRATRERLERGIVPTQRELDRVAEALRERVLRLTE